MLLASGARRTDIPIVITIVANPPEVAIAAPSAKITEAYAPY
jgi:hypothetical protein